MNLILFLLIPGALPHCRGVLRRTERATAREREIEQEQRSKIRETHVTHHNIKDSSSFVQHLLAQTFYTFSWVHQAHRAPDSTPNLLPPSFSFHSRLWALRNSSYGGREMKKKESKSSAKKRGAEVTQLSNFRKGLTMNECSSCQACAPVLVQDSLLGHHLLSPKFRGECPCHVRRSYSPARQW